MKKIERVTIRITDYAKQELQELAEKEKRTLSNYINRVLEKHIEKEKIK